MILYFADRELNILGQASTHLPSGIHIKDDVKTEDVSLGVSIFECFLPFEDATRLKVEECAAVGNYLLRNHDDESELYSIIDIEIDTKKQELYLYAEDAGMDLLNEVVDPYEADKAYPIEHYINKYAKSAGFVIGRNDIPALTKQLSWDSEATAHERLIDIAALFDESEISFSYDISGLKVTGKEINIYAKRGQDLSIPLRLNIEVDKIITTKSIANLATALKCTGGTPINSDKPITLEGYAYDDGDFYVSGTSLVSKKALDKWVRLLWEDDCTKRIGGHITKTFSCEALTQEQLCREAIAELKKCCDAEVNYKVEIKELPANIHIGDRVNLVDDKGELYLNTRLLTIETSVADKTRKAVFGEFKIKGSGISQKVADLAAEFAKNSVSAQRALSIATSAKTTADEAKGEAEKVSGEAAEALQKANEASSVASQATQSAADATTAANNAQAAVDEVEKSVEGLETTVENAEAAAQQAQQAAASAETKATEARTAATNAETKASQAETAAQEAKNKADSVESIAGEAKTKAEQAVANATQASTTAAAAKADAEQAKADIEEFGENLETLENTMTADYARKTELTEASTSLQSQITQNAAGITSNTSAITRIDETANNAAEQAEAAQSAAAEAQGEADKAKSDAAAAQTAADEAKAAAQAAQGEADTAKAAADAAKSVADKAEEDLEKAKTDLATVQGRVDATEEDIQAAQTAVNTAQQAANKAQEDAEAAAAKADTAKNTADSAASNAQSAQTKANEAASAAALAQQAANEAKGNASAAQAKADEAAATATAAQTKANEAVANATTAQNKANEAAQAAADAQSAADAAEAKANQAATDLATAQQNLASVTSRVDATEEEVEAAQAAVETAQDAADKAKQDAAAAQSTADTAKTNAANAQTAANNAKNAADKAQEDATAAQQAADKAQADVDALTTRVTTAETNISQNAEQIELRATKTEVTETLGGYYTKTEADAAISMKANEITLSVEENLSTLAESSSTANATANDASERITLAEAELQILSDSISSLIRDENGESLMVQEGDKWTFSLTDVYDKLNSAAANIDNLQNGASDTESVLTELQDAVNSLGVTTDYITITTYNDKPCIELGEKENEFKVRITNTEIQFADGTSIPAYVSNQKLMIEKAEVKDELQFGGFAWQIRSNGNMSLVWKGVDA